MVRNILSGVLADVLRIELLPRYKLLRALFSEATRITRNTLKVVANGLSSLAEVYDVVKISESRRLQQTNDFCVQTIYCFVKPLTPDSTKFKIDIFS